MGLICSGVIEFLGAKFTGERLLVRVLPHVKFVGFRIEECLFTFYIILIDKIALVRTLHSVSFPENFEKFIHRNGSIWEEISANVPNVRLIGLQLTKTPITKLTTIWFFAKMVANMFSQQAADAIGFPTNETLERFFVIVLFAHMFGECWRSIELKRTNFAEQQLFIVCLVMNGIFGNFIAFAVMSCAFLIALFSLVEEKSRKL